MRLIPEYLIGIVTVYQEAEGEPYQGKVAVAEVIWRRTAQKFMSNGTVIGTCLRRLQFSGWNDNSPNRIRSMQVDTSDPVVNDCVHAWMEAERGSNLVPGCLHYYNPSLCDPTWARGAVVVAEIGHHRFIIPKEPT
jgi:spore germination cell wall hydrolase CwlJ-like protein